ncbi:BREX-1 system adenine-specific DNA-methyltransferase PglX [Prevotella copri]|uniref:BREX-1 system adenine-specific DNA-methyltransferase PglX n=1 Tax=Segatella copri TaxID=165179 RepID=UPI001C3942A7|nr:BREX-1 system adenine-specific DNA-methyltransferase PglX [Segatella copri]MBV3442886.1 BREX-1 system adenine-specific DNA-methyltransferase PglX [Segatella copri]
MDTNRIKRFATEARNILKAGIAAKITTLGFDKNGNVAEENKPRLMQGGSLWNEQLQTEGFYYQWMSLYNRIQQKGINEVYEEAAYTWFNRLCAIRILQKNNLCSPVLAYADAARTPVIVDEARQGRIPQMNEELRQRLVELLDDDTKVTEQFAILITAWCHDNPIINQCFGSIADYTELLLPNNILAEGGFVDMLNHTEFITDEDFQSPELIGWLYQFYISERKDEVFAKKGKFEADEIPAATQIFTPNWIVKYMVQNTVGRIYLDNNPYETQLQKKWQYLVEPSKKPSDKALLKYNELEDLKVADLACGSGHILNECFDLLYDLYIAEGYGRGEAVENIFSHNLTGIDLDTRAKQLSQFALLLKACQKDAAFADAHSMPNVLTMPKPWNRETQGPIQDMLHIYFQGEATNQQKEEIMGCFDLMQDSDSLGSIMKFDISESTRLLIKQTTDYWCNQGIVPEEVHTQIPAFKLILALTEKYHALVMNPPYMGRSGMNDLITQYVHDNYALGKWDLFATFMLVAINRLEINAKMSMINMHSWMFLDAFEALRMYLVKNFQIDNMLHLGPNTFDELSGEVVQNTTFVISKNRPNHAGDYYKLSTGNNCAAKEQLFLNDYGHYRNVDQLKFDTIPSCPIAYWLSINWLKLFGKQSINDIAISKAGIVSGDDNYFVKYWHEVCFKDISFLPQKPYAKFHTFQKGGTNRKYYGNNDYVFKLKDLWDDKFYNKSIRRGDEDSYFKKAIGWSYTGSTENKAFRQIENCICGTGTPTLFAKNPEDYYHIIGFLNSKITSYLLPILNPTLSLAPGYVVRLPYIKLTSSSELTFLAHSNVDISKQDWDAHETSWDFQRNELLSIDTSTYTENIDYKMEKHFEETGEHISLSPAAPQLGSLEWRMEQYKTKWERKFMQLHKNEEELNRQFIDIYGLQDELTPDVPLNEITILQQGEIDVTDNGITWNKDIMTKQLISYAVGCMLGRYRLDKPGLHIAHPKPTDEEIAPYEYNGEQWEIDDDGIMPLMPNDCGFSDNASARFADFIRVALGNEEHVANLNYVEKCLGKTLEQYFVKDFWKDHKKMYQNRPIYWLFSSKKGAFQVITYMHRMNAYTAERVRSKYLLPYIEHLEAEIDKLDARRAELSTKETKLLQTLKKQLDECREYHERLQVVAEQAISFDLDDGVVVNYAKFGDILQKIK